MITTTAETIAARIQSPGKDLTRSGRELAYKREALVAKSHASLLQSKFGLLKLTEIVE